VSDARSFDGVVRLASSLKSETTKSSPDSSMLLRCRSCSDSARRVAACDGCSRGFFCRRSPDLDTLDGQYEHRPQMLVQREETSV
jgi:hypothetical protein